MKKKYFFFILFTYIILSGKTITLEECKQMVKENNLMIAAKKSEVKSSVWQKNNTKGNFFPQIFFNSNIIRIDNDTYKTANTGYDIPGIGTFPALMPIAKTTCQNSIIAQQSIFNGGKVIIGYQLAKIAVDQAILNEKQEANDIILQCVTNYFQILKLQKLIELTKKSIVASQTQLESIQNKEKVGLALKSDVLQWEVKVKNDQIALQEIENSLIMLKKIWRDQLQSEENIEPEPVKMDQYIQNALEFASYSNEKRSTLTEQFLTKVKKNNLELKHIKSTNKIMEKNLLMKKGNFLPSVNLQFTYEIEEDSKFNLSGDENWNLAASISMPLFTGRKNVSEMKAAFYEKRRIEKETISLQNDIFTAAESSYQTMLLLADKITSNQKAMQYAKENQKLIHAYFDQKLVTNTELMNAEIMLFNSEVNLTAAYYDFIIQQFELDKWVNQ